MILSLEKCPYKMTGLRLLQNFIQDTKQVQ